MTNDNGHVGFHDKNHYSPDCPMCNRTELRGKIIGILCERHSIFADTLMLEMVKCYGKNDYFEETITLLEALIPDEEQIRKEERERIGGEMISRAIAGFDGLPKEDAEPFYKGYWQAYWDKGQALSNTQEQANGTADS